MTRLKTERVLVPVLLSGLLLAFTGGCGRFSDLADKPKPLSNTGEVIQAGGDEEMEETLKGAPLGELAQLHKLSMALRGLAPTPEEYQGLKDSLAQKKGSEYLAQKTQEYLHTVAFSERMVLKLDELFYFKSTTARPMLIPGQQSQDSRDSVQYFATDNFFRDLFLQNLSWDTLLIGKKYRFPVFGEEVDKTFFGNILGLPTELSPPFPSLTTKVPDKYEEVSFDANDLRIAGVITSPRFFSRYTATGLNKNRRRAAAIFRTFLCDPMISSIPENHDQKALTDLIFPEGQTVSEGQIVMPMDALHGAQPDCMACHYKLDPLGKTLRDSPFVLHEDPSAGALVFKNSKGELINKPAKGIGEVAKFITEQPDYVSCQVETFWNWFIGSDVAIGKKTRSQLMQSFDGMGRRSSDFVAYLVSRPEFKIRQSKDPQRAMVVEVRNLLKRCDSCHDGVKTKDEGPIPRFAIWPIAGADKAGKWLRKISKSLDLENQGKNRTMPTKEGFKPTTEELANIQKWISQGAPDERGQKMVVP